MENPAPIKYIVQIAKVYKLYFLLILATSCLAAILNTSFGLLLKLLADGIEKSDTSAIFIFVLLFSFQRFLIPIANTFGTLISVILSNKIENDIRRNWHKYVIDLDYGSSQSKNSGEYQKKIHEAISSVRNVINNTLRSALTILLEITSISVISIIFINTTSGIILILFSVIYAFLVVRLTRLRVPDLRSIAESDAKCAAFMHDSFINPTKISPDFKKSRENQYNNLLKTLEKNKNNNARKLFRDNIALAIICSISCASILFYFKDPGTSSIGTTMMLATNLAQLIIQINSLGFNYRNLLSAKIDISRISDGLKIKEDQISENIDHFLKKKYNIFTFSSFTPNHNDKDSRPTIISGNIEIASGFINILQGQSGLGKSTIARAIRKEVAFNDGELFINGNNIKLISQDHLQESIAYVSQDLTIFNQSVYQNLLYGKSNATIDEIRAALKKVDLIKFSDNLNYQVGEKGGLLSGGEKQRLVIARSLLQDSQILIFDEPFTGLDDLRKRDLAKIITSLSQKTGIMVIMHTSPEEAFGKNSIGNHHILFQHKNEIHIRKV